MQDDTEILKLISRVNVLESQNRLLQEQVNQMRWHIQALEKFATEKVIQLGIKQDES